MSSYLRTPLLFVGLLVLAGCATPIERSRLLDPAHPRPMHLASEVIVWESGLVEVPPRDDLGRALAEVGESLLPLIGSALAGHGLTLAQDPSRPAPLVLGDGSRLDDVRWTHPAGAGVDLTEVDERERREAAPSLGLEEGKAGLAISLRLSLEGGSSAHVEARLAVLVFDREGRPLLSGRAAGVHRLVRGASSFAAADLLAAADRAASDLGSRDRAVELID